MVPRISLNESSRCIKKRWTAHDHNPVASSALDINTSLQQVRLQRGYYPQTGVVLNPKFETTRCPAPQTYRKLTSFFRKCVNSPTFQGLAAPEACDDNILVQNLLKQVTTRAPCAFLVESQFALSMICPTNSYLMTAATSGCSAVR